jgi:hypothetical protein
MRRPVTQQALDHAGIDMSPRRKGIGCSTPATASAALVSTALNSERLQGDHSAANGLLPGAARGNDLRQQGIVVRADLLALLVAGFHPHAKELGRLKYAQHTCGGHQGLGILCINAYLDGVALQRRGRLGQPSARG